MASAELVRATPPLTRDERPVGDADELQEMFPTLERAVIESALLQHCGAVEVTVDYLVALTQGDTTCLLQRLPSEDVGGPPRYVELPPQDTTEAGQKGRAARDRTFSAGKKTKTGSKYSRRLFGGHKAAVSSDGLDLELQLQEEGPGEWAGECMGRTSMGSMRAVRKGNTMTPPPLPPPHVCRGSG